MTAPDALLDDDAITIHPRGRDAPRTDCATVEFAAATGRNENACPVLETASRAREDHATVDSEPMSYASHPERTQQPLGAASRFTSIAGDTTETIAKQDRPQSVVVGIDGTQAALDAAAWAVAEAASLGLPLRLVHVSVARTPAGHSDSVADDARHAESMLYLAEMVVHDMATPVNIETTIVQGSPDYVLIDESRSAALVCVGAAGKGPCARMPLGSTAAALAKHAHRRGGYAERQFC